MERLNTAPITSDILASGTINGREATPTDFGAGIAQGVGAIGGAVDQAGNVANQIDQDQGRIWAATAVSQKELQWKQDFNAKINGLDPTSPDYPQQITQITSDTQAQVSQAQQDLMDAAPTRSASKFVSWHMASAGLRMNDTAIQTQASLNADYTKGLVTQGIKADTDLLSASPDNDTYARLMDKQHDTIMGLQTIPPNVKASLLTEVQHQYSQVQATAAMNANPQAFLQGINLQGGITKPNGAQVGGVPTQAPGAPGAVDAGGVPQQPAQPEILAFANQQLAAGATPEAALRSVASQDRFRTSAGHFAFTLAPDGKAFVDNGVKNPSMFVAGNPTGLLQTGNIDIANRPIAHNADGSISTVRSMSISEDGKSILIPTVSPDGKVLSDKAAIDLYHQTGQHLGVFATDAQADAYSQSLHEQQAAMYDPQQKDPNVQPLTDQAIASAKPPLAGWNNLGFQEKVQLVRQAEGLVGKSLASTRGQGEVQMQDAMKSFSDGQMYPDINNLKAQNTATLNPAEAQRRNDTLDAGQQFAGFKAQVATMPDAQAGAWLNQYKPQGGDEFAVKQPLYQMALNAFGSAQNDRRTAPVDYAVKNGIGGAQPLDLSNPQNFGAGLRQRVAVNATMQRDYGAPPAIFANSEIPQVTEALTKLSSHDAVGYLGSIAHSLGNTADFTTAMGQLKVKSPLLSYAGQIANTGATVNVGGVPMDSTDIAARVIDGDRILNKQFNTAGGNDPDMPAGANAVKLNEQQFMSAFNSALPASAFQSPNAAQSAGAQKDIFNAVKAYYVADSYAKGRPMDVIYPQAVHDAVDAITGGVVPVSGSSLMVPYGMKPQDFQAQWRPRARAALIDAGQTPESVDAFGAKLQPINVGEGLYRFMNGSNILINPHTGQPVTVDYGKPAPAKPEAPTPLLTGGEGGA